MKVVAPETKSRLGVADWALMALAVASFLFVSWFRRHGIFWSDEICGWFAVQGTTWHDVVRIWASGTDSSGFYFYVFARPWLKIFGANETSLHLMSALFVGLGLVVTWVCARRYASLGIVAVVLPLVFYTNRIVILQVSNGRTYGIVLFAVALICYAMFRTEPGETTWGGVGLVLVAFSLITGLQVLGMLYWGVFFAGFLLRDLLAKRAQWRVYVAILAGLTIVPLSLKNLKADIDMGKPTYWTPRPSAHELLMAVGDISAAVTAMVVLAAVVFLALYFSRPKAERGPLVPADRRSLYCLFASFAFMILLMFTLSRIGKSIFVDRYLLPVTIGDCLLLCELLSRTKALLGPGRAVRLGLLTVGGLAVLGLFGFALRRQGYPQKDYTAALVAAMPDGEPVVLTDVSRFIETTFYRNHERTIVCPLDWSIQLDPDYGYGGASFSHELEDFKSVGILADQIQASPEILTNRHFVVVSDVDHTLWFRRYVLGDPRFVTRELPGFENLRIWQVDRRD